MNARPRILDVTLDTVISAALDTAINAALKIIALSAAALFLTGCATNLLLPSEVKFTHQELSERMAKRFPVEKSIAGLLDVKLSRPRVDAREEDGKQTRLGFTFDADVKSVLTNKTITGTVLMSGVPKYNSATREIFLSDAKVDSLRADNMPDALSAALAKAASGMAKDYLEGKPIYSFKEEDLKRYGMTINPQRIDVARDGIALVMR